MAETKRQFGGAWAFLAIPLVVFVYFVSQILAAIFLTPFAGHSSSKFEELANSSVPFQFGFIAITEILTLLMLLGLMRLGKVNRQDIGLGRGPKSSDVGYGAMTFVGYFVVLAVIMALVQQFAPTIDVNQEQQIGFDGANGMVQLALVFTSLAILPPLVEELMIRGFLFSGLASKLPKIIAAIVASVIFGIAHLQLGSGAPPLWTAAIDTFVLSMFLIGLRLKTGSLWAGIFVHGLKNTLAFLVLFVFHVSS